MYVCRYVGMYMYLHMYDVPTYVFVLLRSIGIKGYVYSLLRHLINTTTAVQNTQWELLSSTRTPHRTGHSRDVQMAVASIRFTHYISFTEQ